VISDDEEAKLRAYKMSQLKAKAKLKQRVLSTPRR